MSNGASSPQPVLVGVKHVAPSSSDDGCSGQQTEDEKLDFLAEAFPNFSREVTEVKYCQIIGASQNRSQDSLIAAFLLSIGQNNSCK